MRTMMSDMWRIAGNFLADSVHTAVNAPADWRGYASTFGGVLGLPVVPLLRACVTPKVRPDDEFRRYGL